MYKTKLQELCHKKQWGSPQYSTMKDGPDHDPSFKASASVNGHLFHSPVLFKSSKAAQNDAAKLAFQHYFPSCNDLQGQYKSRLNDYSQWKNLDPPSYTSKTAGPSHAIHFKATVTVGGQAFESPEFFKTLKEAEHAAAKAALMSLPLDGFQKDDSGLYKNLLQELAQREGFCIPKYNSIKAGASYMPTFFTSVEVGGQVFRGGAGKSKKQAEMNAAKVAFAFLEECGLSRNAEVDYPILVEEEPLSTTSLPLAVVTESQQNLDHQNELLPSPTTLYEEHPKESTVDEVQEVALMETLLASVRVDTGRTTSYPAELQRDKNKENVHSFSCGGAEPASPKQSRCSPELAHPKPAALISIPDSNMGKNPGTKSYLLCNRVRVYSSYPDVAFPSGITVLPISDNKWVAVSLEFPS